jgi:hypothetical protein
VIPVRWAVVDCRTKPVRAQSLRTTLVTSADNMSNLEAELARFEAELAAVETSQAAAEPSQQQEHGGPAPHHAQPHHAQLSAPATTSSGPPSAAPAVAPEPQPVQYHQTGPMYHEVSVLGLIS